MGWIAIACLPRVPRARKGRFVMWGVVGWIAVAVPVLFSNAASRHDSWGMLVTACVTAALAIGVVVGVRSRRRLGLAPAFAGTPSTPSDAPAGSWPAPGPTGSPVPTTVGTPAPGRPPSSDLARVVAPETLPTFRSVGGMDRLKQELRDTLGLALAFSDKADAYKVTWNGVLLHGPPGVGKSFVVQATAGEFGLNLVSVSAADLVSSYRGESARNVDAVFALAASRLPAVLFFDEFDSIAARRDDNPDQEARRTVNALLGALERTRPIRELVVMAATNDVGALDPAVVRPGRFDRQILVPLPDLASRQAIFRAQLAGRPGSGDVDVAQLAQRTEGLTPAAIAQLVAAASMSALHDAASHPDDDLVPLTTERLLAALRDRGGHDRPTVEGWSWDRLVLPAATLAELKEVAVLLEDPARAASYGVKPPSGILLYGPPGTGKTTVARVLAAEARCSFYEASAADLTSKWLGESERLVQQLFVRAREQKPSIVFIDEIDAIAGARGEWSTYDRQVNQLLQELDGMDSTEGVLVIGATNRRDKVDPALLRGGRLSRQIELPLPDRAARRQLLAQFTATMPLDGVDLDRVAARTDGLAGADIEALCQQAGMRALVRRDGQTPAVSQEDIDAALADIRSAAPDGHEVEHNRAPRGGS
jgi:transitional endoplasmic reticulum ATPase